MPLASARPLALALALPLALLAGACSDHADDAAQDDAAARGQQSDPVQSSAGASANAAGASGAAAAAAGSSGAPAPSPRDAAADANATDADHAADGGSDPAPACCVATNAPGCADPTVEKCVCDADPTCCAQAWDEFCIQVAAALKCAPCTPP